MLFALIFTLMVMVGSFIWYCVVSFKRALKLWEAAFIYIGMMYGAIVSGLLLSTFL